MQSIRAEAIGVWVQRSGYELLTDANTHHLFSRDALTCTLPFASTILKLILPSLVRVNLAVPGAIGTKKLLSDSGYIDAE